MKVNGKRILISETVAECRFGLMDRDMKVIGEIIEQMEEED